MAVAFGQQATDQPPLTPEQQREKELRKYDPLDKTNPAAPDQNQGQPADAAKPSTTNSAKPLPGSVAASGTNNTLVPANPRGQGPEVVAATDTDSAPAEDYGGPAVLSRSYTLARPIAPQELKWSWTVGTGVVYDTGLTNGTVNPNGTLANVDAWGNSITWGVHGRHFWKHDQIGLSYSGNYNRYDYGTAYNGSNHSLNFDLSHQISRHLSINLVESGSIVSQSYSLANPGVGPEGSIANINLAVSPGVQILNQGARQFSTMTNLTWQKSTRLSVSMGGGFFAVDYLGAGFAGTVGYQAQADVNYRLTRKMTVGAYYSFSDYNFSRHVDVNSANTAGGIFSYALNRTTQIRLRGGITHSESLGLTAIPIDPAIAALIGRSAAFVDAYNPTWLQDVSAQFAKDFGRRKTANISYAHGLAPGNGLLLASAQDSVSAGFSAGLFRNYSVSVGVSRTELSSVSQTLGTYTSEGGNVTLSHTYGRGLTASLGVDYRKYTLSNSPILQSQFRITSGFSWGPGDGKLW